MQQERKNTKVAGSDASTCRWKLDRRKIMEDRHKHAEISDVRGAPTKGRRKKKSAQPGTEKKEGNLRRLKAKYSGKDNREKHIGSLTTWPR